ncbi:glycoside hydrolase family 3 protein [Streptomyces sp. NPDC088812]|uniref:glycoside hydrolase family 3 protein n=1 Tax=Streptomyces sp. NPDC088812 TaxID=3365905 RepID=UPI00380060F8
MVAKKLKTAEGVEFRDLNHNGTMEPYEDPRLDAAARAADLTGRMTVEEKVGLLFQAPVPAGPEGDLVTGPTPAGDVDTAAFIVDRHINHLYTFDFASPEIGAAWNNRLQDVAASTRLGIPVTVSTDPRNSFGSNPGAGMRSRGFSMWPETLGLAALRDEETVRCYADIARQEYVATGIRAALHPQVDLPTHPRWARQYNTLGTDPELASRLVVAYLDGFQRSAALGPDSVACTTKHFPGGGAQKDGEDPHFVYGREQVYPGGRFEDHLAPFRAAIAAGTSGIMPYYGMPVGLSRHGKPVPEVGFAFNEAILRDLLRDELGFEGVVLTDFTVVTDGIMFGRRSIGRAWGVEHLSYRDRVKRLLDAGVDQIGGEHCTELLLELVQEGQVCEARLDESVLRLLKVKFELGLFDDPYVDVDAAARIVGREEFLRAGLRAQSRSVTVLTNRADTAESAPVLPLRPTPGQKVYTEGMDESALRDRGLVCVRSPQDADFALVRLSAPYTPRDDYALEAFFHAGTLTFDKELQEHVLAVASTLPTIVDVYLDRPAMLEAITAEAAAVTANWGTSDAAWLDAVLSEAAPAGTLPIEVPRSEEAVDASLPDVGAATENPLFRLGHGIRLACEETR